MWKSPAPTTTNVIDRWGLGAPQSPTVQKKPWQKECTTRADQLTTDTVTRQSCDHYHQK